MFYVIADSELYQQLLPNKYFDVFVSVSQIKEQIVNESANEFLTKRRRMQTRNNPCDSPGQFLLFQQCSHRKLKRQGSAGHTVI